ncbi:UNVERIFIED_CONTAM: hypothetical protein Cloal_1423 [Acetivibrio alkalicellulosi]
MNTEVVKHIFPLLDTMEKGIIHIQKQLSELRYEEAFTVLEDTMHGIACIEKVLEGMKGELPKSHIDQLTAKIKECMSIAVSNYENKKEVELQKHINSEMLPVFTDWKDEIEKSLSHWETGTDTLSN